MDIGDQEVGFSLSDREDKDEQERRIKWMLKYRVGVRDSRINVPSA